MNGEKLKTAGKAFLGAATWLASAVVWPFYKRSWAKAAVFAATGLVTTVSASNALFPRAEKVLQEEGFNPNVAQELAPGKKVYVRDSSLLGRLGTRLSEELGDNYFKTDAGDFETPGFVNVTSLPLLGEVCNVHINPDVLKDPAGIKIPNFLGNFLGAKAHEDTFVKFPSNANDVYHWALLHEMRHCSEENKREKGFMNEADADYHAIRVIQRETGNKDIGEAALLFRSYASLMYDEHDTALYLDAKFRKAAMPSADEMMNANNAAAAVDQKLDDQRKKMVGNECGIKENAAVCSYDPASDIQKLSPLAKRRVELFRKALDKNLPLPVRTIS